jgi:hypothetical protein
LRAGSSFCVFNKCTPIPLKAGYLVAYQAFAATAHIGFDYVCK